MCGGSEKPGRALFPVPGERRRKEGSLCEFGRTWLERQAPERLQQLRELVNAPVP
ncbi:MAG: hypothetical protein KatS3mg132_521 [Limisphaera sp.]|nr:MAG: hypothetical protein KatS3mg132_521 [Limisphaera sp.]